MGIRDRALLTFGWFSAMRRSALVKLNWQDISFIKEGINLKAWKKINNNEVVFCSVNKADKVTGIRLSCIDVARITKKHSAKIDFDTSKIAEHSLRRGFVTTTVSSGIRSYHYENYL